MYNGVNYEQQQLRRYHEYLSKYPIQQDIVKLDKLITKVREISKTINKNQYDEFYDVEYLSIKGEI